MIETMKVETNVVVRVWDLGLESDLRTQKPQRMD